MRVSNCAGRAATALADGNTATSREHGTGGAHCGTRGSSSHARASSGSRERRAMMIEFLWQLGFWTLLFIVCWLLWGRNGD